MISRFGAAWVRAYSAGNRPALLLHCGDGKADSGVRPRRAGVNRPVPDQSPVLAVVNRFAIPERGGRGAQLRETALSGGYHFGGGSLMQMIICSIVAVVPRSSMAGTATLGSAAPLKAATTAWTQLMLITHNHSIGRSLGMTLRPQGNRDHELPGVMPDGMKGKNSAGSFPALLVIWRGVLHLLDGRNMARTCDNFVTDAIFARVNTRRILY